MRIPFALGSSNIEQSYIADQEELINSYEAALRAGSSSPKALYPTPGVTSIGSVASGPGRAHAVHASREWAIAAGTFYEINEAGAWTSLGSVAIGDNPGTISYNGDGGGELFITSGGNGYIWDIAAETLTQITALNGIADIGDQIDGYFLALDQSTSTVYFSALLDGTTWSTGTSFFQRSAASDGWKGLKVLNGELIWLLGSNSSEVWYNAGTFPVPFEPHPSGRGIEYGIDAPFTVAVNEGVMYWLGSTVNGRGMVLRTSGFSPERISTPAVELALEGYADTSQAQGDAYVEAGHGFYVVRIPREITWGFDTGTGTWHKRGTWISESNRYNPWRPIHHAYVFDEHRWLDAETGDVYRASVSIATDVDSRPLRRLRRAPATVFENQRLFYSAFELLMDVGIGTLTPAPVTVMGSGGPALSDSLFSGASFWAYYEFEQDGTDENGGTSDLTATNSPTYVLGPGQTYAAALDLVTDTSDSPHFVLAAASAGSFNPGTSDFVLAAWFRVTEDAVGRPPIWTKGAASTDTPQPAGWNLFYDSIDGPVKCIIGDGGAAVTLTSTVSPVKGAWHSVVVNVNRTTDVASMYIDGEAAGTASTSTLASVTNSQDLMAGGIDPKIVTGGAFDGQLDQVVFLVGDLWSADQISYYHNQGLAQGSDPQVMLRFSDDGGKTWSSEIWRSAGEIGKYDTRVRWNRLGAARKRVFEIIVSDPVPWRLVDAYMEISQPPRRLSAAQAQQWGG